MKLSRLYLNTTLMQKILEPINFINRIIDD